MSELQPLLLVLLAAAIGAAALFWRKIAALEASLRTERQALEGKRSEIDKVKQDSRQRLEELEATKRQLADTRSKLKKREQKELPAGSGGSKRQRAAEEVNAPELGSAATVVRIADHELESRYRETTDRLEGELAEARQEVERLKKAEERRKAEAERAAKALAAAAATTEAPAPAAPAAMEAAATPEAQKEALEAQLEAFRRAAVERERSLEKKLAQAEGRANAANKRAASNHSLYQVIKGQLEIAEDKLALFKRKYEGAKKPESLKPERPRAEKNKPRTEAAVEQAAVEQAPAEAPVEQAPAAEQAVAPAEHAAPAAEQAAERHEVAAEMPTADSMPSTLPAPAAEPEAPVVAQESEAAPRPSADAGS